MALEEAASAQIAGLGFFVLFLWILVAVIVIGAILLFAGWIYMIVDCAKRKKFQHGDQVLWILLLALTGLIGMLLYYFMEMRK